MSISELPDRPAMSSPELGNESEKLPLGKMPIAACLVGCLSLLTPLSLALLPLSILASALGAVVLWKQTREANFTGKLLAQIGLGLGVATGAWSMTSTRAETEYLTKVASENATAYLEKISQGKVYEALELHLPVRQRQIAGTNLKEYYELLRGEAADKVAGIQYSPATKVIEAAGPSANWQMVRCVRIGSIQSQKALVLEFANTNSPNQPIEVELRRETHSDENGSAQAQWIVKEVKLPDNSGNPS